MDFSWSEEQLALRELCKQFGERELNSGYAEREREGTFNWEAWRKASELGLTGMPLPKEYGGQGLDVLTTLLAMEGLGHGGKDAGFILSLGASTIICAVPIWQFGTEAQKQQYLPRLCSGEWVGGLALTEPDAGSDAAALSCRAERDGDHYVLNGRKIFITNGSISDLLLVIARTGPGKNGVTGFLVTKGTPGFRAERDLDKVGLRTSPTSELIFEDARIPAANMVGQEGQGFALAMATLEWERACLISFLVGAMERRLEQTLAYVTQRAQFGQPIAQFQMVQERLADMKVHLEAARLLVYKAGWLKQIGQPALLDASIAKLFMSEAAIKDAVEALKLHGGYGVVTEYEVERELRDTLPGPTGGGTSNIQRLIIARELLRGLK